MPQKIELTPIGFVRNSIAKPHREEWQNVESEIILKDDMLEALDGLTDFSHITVLYWMHLVPESERSLPKIHPQGRQDLPLVGVLATRAPARPNPIGVTTVKLLEQRGTTLRVLGLDAVDGTPVLDIKPFTKGFGPEQRVRVPEWLKRLESNTY